MKLADILNFTLDWLYRGAHEEQTMQDNTTAAGWSEATSEQFVDFGDYFVPEREAQIETIRSLIPDARHPHVVERCRGEGRLSAALAPGGALVIADPIDQPSSLLDQLKWLEQAGLENADVHWLKAGHAIFSAVKPG